MTQLSKVCNSALMSNSSVKKTLFKESSFYSGKVKPLSTSINDADGFKMRAACVCVKSRNEQEVSFCPLVTTRTRLKSPSQVLFLLLNP